jgi:cytochrome c biogenesis protein CcmG, thiol:disulfide interchange protein DsbE
MREASPTPPEPAEDQPVARGWLSGAMARNLAASVVFGIAAIGLVWFFTQGGGNGGSSQSVNITAKASGPAPRVGKAAPEFRIAALDGTPIELSALRGHPVWINFWATWCPPCREESPEIEAAYEQYRDQGLVVVAIDVGEAAATARDYVQRAGLTYLVGGDPNTDVAATYRVTGLPTHVFIDSDGIVRDIRLGRLGKDTIQQELAKVLPAAAGGRGTP